MPGESSNPAGVDVNGVVLAAAAGDRLALQDLLSIIRPKVVRYCRARVGREETLFTSADDVAQEVCLAVITALPGYRDQGRPFLAFVYGIAAHKVADAHRSSMRSRTHPVAEVPDTVGTTIDPMTHVMNGERATRMSALLASLPPRQQEIIRLRVVVGLSAEETAEALGSTAGAVRVAQHRALGKLRNALATAS